MRRRFPSVEEVIGFHDYLILRFGGEFGVRDEGALESALLRPQVGSYDGIVAEVAALMEGLFNYRQFVDGNKRTATAVREMFLLGNGYSIAVDDDFEAYDFFMQLFDEGAFLFANLEPWLMEHVKPLP